ncbi:MAG: 4Fe-4S binding protein [Candidatus Binatia bacterium]
MTRWPRRMVQISALAFLIAVPALNYGGVLYQQYGKNGYHKIALMGTLFERGLYNLFSAMARVLPNPAGNSTSLVGGYGSFSIFGISFLDPVIALETVLRVQAVWTAILVGAALPLLLAVLLGRIFCGWLCPVNTVLEGFDLLRKRALPRIGFRPLDVAVPRWLKWVLLFAGVTVAVLADLTIWTHLLPHVQIGRDVFSLIVFGTTTVGAPLLLGIILAEILFSRRVWCRSLCPTGALLGLAALVAPLRVRRAKEPCLKGCAACAQACPMALNPAKPFPVAECYNCGLCVATCPAQLLTLGFPRPRWVVVQEIFPMFKRMTLFVLTATLLLSSPAAAHHMRGQPHYGYAENYPQVPTKETRAHIGNFDITIVSYFFEGLRRDLSDTPHDVQFYVGLSDSRTHQSYMGPLSIELWRGGQRIATFNHTHPFEEAVYRIRQAVPGPGTYEIRLAGGGISGVVTVDVEGESAQLTPFILTGAAALLGLLIFLNRRRRQRRRVYVASNAQNHVQ